MSTNFRRFPNFPAAVLVGATLLAAPPAFSSELVYTPVNPAFGGSPLNGAVLLNAAQAQNKTKDPDSVQPSSPGQSSSLQQFNDLLERSILNRLAAAATGNIVGANGQLVPGTIETNNFTIAITDLGGGVLQITTTDNVSGAVTSFQVGQP